LSIYKLKSLDLNPNDTSNLQLITCIINIDDSYNLQEINNFLEPFSKYYVRFQPTSYSYLTIVLFCLKKEIIIPIELNQKTISNGDWNNPSIWENNKIPETNSEVIIEHEITLNDNIYLSKLEVNNKLIVSPGKYIMITDSLILNDDIILKSDENSTAQLLDNGIIIGNGNLKVEMYITGGYWHNICPSVSNIESDLFLYNLYYKTLNKIIKNY